MAITSRNLPKKELIGLQAEVIESTDDSQVGIKGEITGETRDMLEIDGKMVEKENCVFLVEIPTGEKVKLKGDIINKRPEDRKKMRLPDKWQKDGLNR